MSDSRKELGKNGESLACHFLIERGMKIVGTNVRMRVGEIDILAEDGDALVIVEVKTKMNNNYGIAEEKVDRAKQKKLKMLARELSGLHPDRVLRIDVVAINNFIDRPEINYIFNAVTG